MNAVSIRRARSPQGTWDWEQGPCELGTNLPYGQKRMLELARALASRPEILLLDEPAAGLNPYETGELSSLLLEIREGGLTILIVEHDMGLVMDISDEVSSAGLR